MTTGEKIELTKEDMINLVSENGLKRSYHKIRDVLEEYMDLEKSHYSLVALWIMGTYLHKQFPAYPYLFFNAMKGSGKTRLLKIISNLAKDGKVAGSMTEAVLFRTAKDSTLCIDEFEGMNAKGNENLKLLLNAGYKKGTKVQRLIKKKTLEGESQVIEEFEVYCPIAMANIRGMENVLGDRCISLILEKSSKTQITKLIENFEYDMDFQTIRGGLRRLTEKLKEDSNIFGHIFLKWNTYQKNKVSDVNDVNDTKDVNKVSRTDNIDEIDNITTLFQKIDKTNISGRDLELFLPLFIIADMCSKEIFDNLIELAKNIVKEKKESDREENKHVKLIEFIAQSNYEGFVNTEDIAKEFSEFIEEDPKYNTSRSVSRTLNTLKLILDKRSTGKKRQIRLNILKAQEKLLMFKDIEEIKIDFSKSKIKEVLEDG